MMRERGKQKGRLNQLGKQLIDVLDMPLESVAHVPIITMTGNKELSIENFKGFLEYTPQRMRISTQNGVLVIEGIELEAKSMTEEMITIRGIILQIGFVQ